MSTTTPAPPMARAGSSDIPEHWPKQGSISRREIRHRPVNAAATYITSWGGKSPLIVARRIVPEDEIASTHEVVKRRRKPGSRNDRPP
jgi:hypothetical protein